MAACESRLTRCHIFKKVVGESTVETVLEARETRVLLRAVLVSCAQMKQTERKNDVVAGQCELNLSVIEGAQNGEQRSAQCARFLPARLRLK